ncbi:hypothetical protein [Solwaraspora sp. WMMA2065]|uniref:hypothetical protein n=1 Tax=Solwaraspora sp. WMMA2065 TaxID=3015166 RepID=UPI00259B7038|nr:hypothetical protein [Solwaraspora sp. WMMA2065]WJK35385.1 hypothetical protein O7610_03125 [Solwaraspora sp. WMMA2065]
MTEFHDWDDVRSELHDGDDAALATERARTEAWISAFHLTEERGDTARPTPTREPALS